MSRLAGRDLTFCGARVRFGVVSAASPRPRRRSRITLALLLAAVAAGLSGCVYLRLLKLKHQFADFDRNFAVDTSDGLRLACLHPVLLSDDIRWLGLPPEQVTSLRDAERWRVRCVKQLPPNVHERGQFDIEFELLFSRNKLTRLVVPERYFAVMPKSLLVDLLRSLGGAEINRDRRAVDAALAAAHPNLPAIRKLLGAPSGERDDPAVPGGSIFTYRFHAVTSERTSTPEFTVEIHFDREGALKRWVAHTPLGSIGFVFTR